ADVVDWVKFQRKRGQTDDQIKELLEEIIAEDQGEDGGGFGLVKVSQADLLLRLAEQVELFKSAGGADAEAVASFVHNGHRENWAVKSQGFRKWLIARFYTEFRKAPGTQALQEAIATLDAKAFSGELILPTAVRLAEHEGAVYLDLADEGWRAVKVDATGWRV